MKVRTLLPVLILSLLGQGASGEIKTLAPIRVAALFAQSTGKEYICIAKAFERIARAQNINMAVSIVEYDNSISDLIEKTNLIVSQKYDVVIGPRTSQETIATTPILGAAKIVQILPSASQRLSNELAPMAISMVPDSDRYGALSAKHIVKNLKSKNILVVANMSMPYSTNYADILPKQLNDLGYKGKIERFDFIEGSAEFDKIAAKAKSSNVDLIYAALYGMDVGNLYAAIAKADIRATIFARAGIFEIKDMLYKQYSPKVHLIFNGIWDGSVRGSYKKDFQNLMKNECKSHEVSVRSVTGFEAFSLLLEVLKPDPNLRGAELLTGLRKSPLSGLMGQRKNEPKTGALLLNMPIFALTQDGFQLLKVVD